MTVVVAGGTRGIGLALARGLEGEDVVVGYSSDAAAGTRARDALAAQGRAVTVVQADLSTADGARRLVDAVPRDQTISCLVHSCVRIVPGPLAALGEDAAAPDWEAALAVNATSLLWLVRAARGRLVRGSSVLYLTSRGARVAVPGYGSVGPSKGLGEALVRYLAVELAADGVRVNALAPGTQDTEALRAVFGDSTDAVLEATRAKNPSGRLVEESDYVAVARFLASPEAAMVTGQVHYVHGGADLLG